MRFKIILLLVSGLLWSHLLSAQNIGINETGANPHGSAILDVSSTNKGMLIPRMTTAQRTGIAGPADGLLVYDTNTSSFWFYDGGSWVELISGTINGNTLDEAYDEGAAGAGRIISADAGVVSVQGTDGIEVTGTFGSGAGIGSPGAGTRMFFNPRKAAFRAGSVTFNQWNDANVGDYSIGLGRAAEATGTYDAAIGFGARATGTYSTAIGWANHASGAYSLAAGGDSDASGFASVAIGRQVESSGSYSFSAGFGTVASGESSSSFGNSSTASGNFSLASGFLTNAEAQSVSVFGRYNVGGGNPTSWTATDPLFEVGNGSSSSNLSNAFTILKNGNVGLSTANPSATLDLVGTFQLVDGNEAAGRVLTSDANGNATWTAPPASGGTLDEAYDFGGIGAGRVITADAGVVSVQGSDGMEVTGTFNSGVAIGNPGAGTRMFFNPRKSAFRAGTVSGNQWNNATVGDYSVALGLNTRASGEAAFAAGSGSQANSSQSVAIGLNNLAGSTGAVAIGSSNTVFFQGGIALGNGNSVGASYGVALGFEHALSGSYSSAIGYQNTTAGTSALGFGYETTASANFATAFGNNTTASATLSTTFGHHTRAESYASFALGRYNEGGGNANLWVATDPVFEVGIGTTPTNLNNAMTILKNGNTGIGTHTPSATLHIDGSVRIENGTEATGRVLTSDANGNATWTAPPASGGTLDEAYDFGGAGAGRVITADAGVVSVQGTDGIEVTGTFGSGAGIGSPGAGTRMLFNPRKSAFRAGYVSGNQWNGANVGNYSAAFGNGTTASGVGSFATGQSSNASGDNSVALGNSTVSGNYSISAGTTNAVSGDYSAVFGQENIVSGDNAVAMGYTNFVSGEAAVAMGETTTATGYAAVSIGNFTTASGYSSSAFGNSTTASGYASTAFGYLTTAESYLSVAYGRYNVGGGNGTSWQPQDAIFEIGIGSSIVNKENAVTVLKNGNTGLGTATPSSTLHVDGAVRIEDGTEAAGRVLVSDNDGNAAWTESVGFSCIRTTPVALTQGNAIVFNFAYHNRGNAYNQTTGEFTAPVEGLYQFHYIEHNSAAANANTGITIRKNGTFYKQLHTIQVVSSTRYANTITWAMELDESDVVTIELLGVSRTISGSAGGSAIKSSLEGFLIR